MEHNKGRGKANWSWWTRLRKFRGLDEQSKYEQPVITTNVMYLKESRETGSAVPSRIKRQISREPSPSFRVGVNSFTPSTAIGTVPDLDQVTQLRTDRVHCLEFASTEEIILQAVRAKPESHRKKQPLIARGSATDLMHVVQFRPAWEIQAYLRFARLPYRVENSLYMGSEATGLYPSLVDGQFVLPGEHATGHISRRRKDLDRNLTKEEKAEAHAFSLAVREGLQPLLRVLRYKADEGEIRQTVYPPMKQTLPWPLSSWSPGAEERRSFGESALRGYSGLHKDVLISRASKLYADLNLRLGGKDAYFFGATPTSLDACVFGHLAEAWTIPALLDLLPAFDNLSRFFRRVCDEYFRPGSFPDDGGGRDGNRDGDDHALGGVAESKGSGVDEPESPEGDGEDVRGISDSGVGGGGESDVLREAMMRADFVNSLNAFNQLEGCALCAEVPYIPDHFPKKPIANAGISAPVLAGFTAARRQPAGAGTAAGDNPEGQQLSDDFVPLMYTAIGAALFFILSALNAAE